MRSALAALVLAVPSLAAANPVTVGVALGATESKTDASAGADANDTYGLYGRVGFTPYLSGQLEIQKIQTDSSTTIRGMNALAVVDIMQHSMVVPIAFVGLGLDHAGNDFQTTDAHHFEAGIGVELRTAGGFMVGLDVRIGDRSIDDQTSKAVPGPIVGAGAAPLPPSSDLHDGQYRSARIAMGVQF